MSEDWTAACGARHHCEACPHPEDCSFEDGATDPHTGASDGHDCPQYVANGEHVCMSREQCITCCSHRRLCLWRDAHSVTG
jgi:hypothetical protein